MTLSIIRRSAGCLSSKILKTQVFPGVRLLIGRITPLKTYSVSEACELIGCSSERWLVKRVRNGTFPARKVVRDIRFTENDIEVILNQCAFVPTQNEVPFMPELSERSRRRVS